MKTIPSLATYSLLGRSGLRVSPLALGTMTFGTEWGWGSPKETVFVLLDRYLEAGGNLLDTADGYTNGTSERLIGEYFAARGGRDRAVLATKFTFSGDPGDPNAGGNGRKNIHRALEGSLKRLRTDYVDLYWLHAWDGLTPVEEVMGTLDALVRAGKVRYLGLSDVPAWYLGRAQTLAEWRGWERLAGLQLEYSLVERNIEREHVPAALALGLGITPWSPLASGLLSGKYTRAGRQAQGQGRLPTVAASGHPAFEKLLTERNWTIVDTLIRVAKEIGAPPAQVALAWVARRPGVASTIIGATRIEQLESNLAALDVVIPEPLLAQLDEVSAPPLVHPYHFFLTPVIRGRISGGTTVQAEPAGYRPKT
ncbi:MAG TPA: aldo/keto reductase [Patescibacteria group bacterium]|nr:aldo/keto reductase [Patescibacteria group bacterium]